MTSLAKDFSMQNSLFKTFLDVNFLFVNRFSKFLAAHFRTKGMLNHDNICMDSVVIREKPPPKRCCIRSKSPCMLISVFIVRIYGINSS